MDTYFPLDTPLLVPVMLYLVSMGYPLATSVQYTGTGRSRGVYITLRVGVTGKGIPGTTPTIHPLVVNELANRDTGYRGVVVPGGCY